MAQQSQQQQKQQGMEAAEQAGTDPWLMAAGGSVALSLYYFFIKDNQEMGQFVGLWPPTFLAFASYFRQTEAREKAKQSME